MLGQYPGHYFDGETAVRHDVRATLTTQGIDIIDRERRLLAHWPHAALFRPRRLAGRGGVAVTSESAPDAELVIEDRAAYKQLLGLLPRHQGLAGRLRPHRWEIILITGLVVGVVGGIFFGIPLLAKPLAKVMPASWTNRLGEVVERTVVQGATTCDDAAGVRALERLSEPLLRAAAQDQAISIRVIDRPIVNAFAAPGGRIVFMRGLIGAAKSPDEVAGVLAHEIGHAVERHPTASAIRVLGVMTLIDLVMGDNSVLLETLGGAGGLLLLTAYSREAETEADGHALALLGAAGIDAQGFAEFFDRMARKHGKAAKIFSYISTHPAVAKRQQRAEAAAGRGSRPALNEADWQALRKICDSLKK